ncbi:conserved hypothetical protein, partial [Trichinella spiralis]|uniref:hypothetical protein n=1 Tax=Trichinella spiralis TaxID=6334 RepID=UPI0001EFDE5E
MSPLSQCVLNVPSQKYVIDIRLYSCVGLSWPNGVTQYCSRNLCGFAYHRSTSICTGFRIHHTSLVVHVAISSFDVVFLQRFVITSINTSSQSTATSCCRSVWQLLDSETVKGNMV